jgi:YhcH/YjgK/YiaL family protein
MIISSLENFSRYFGLNPLFEDVSGYFFSNDLKEFAPGEYEIKGRDLYLIIATGKHDKSYKPKLEVHRKYIDIQVALEGDFSIAWRSLDSCKEKAEPYDSEKDYELFSDSPDFTCKMFPGSICILFPEDAHAALTPDNYIKKAIFKVAIDVEV